MLRWARLALGSSPVCTVRGGCTGWSESFGNFCHHVPFQSGAGTTADRAQSWNIRPGHLAALLGTTHFVSKGQGSPSWFCADIE